MRPIGLIHSPYKQKFGTPRQSGLVPAAVGEVQLDPQWAPEGCLAGLEDFSHIWLIFHFHENNFVNNQGKVQPPRLRGEKMGVFATRSPHRPNPIGMSLVKLESVDHKKNKLVVSGVDLIDKTPLFDIKPYIHAYDSATGARSGWLETTEDQQWLVQWSTPADHLSTEQKNLIEQSLKRDLRNLNDQQDSRSDKVHKSRIDHFDVHFRYFQNKVLVERIKTL